MGPHLLLFELRDSGPQPIRQHFILSGLIASFVQRIRRVASLIQRYVLTRKRLGAMLQRHERHQHTLAAGIATLRIPKIHARRGIKENQRWPARGTRAAVVAALLKKS